jgi:vacuolar-type H+-ATPase subunit F/Vma7
VARVVAIGDELRMAGFALAGAIVIVAADAEATERAIDGLTDDAGLIILGQAPDTGVRAALGRHPRSIWCSLPS